MKIKLRKRICLLTLYDGLILILFGIVALYVGLPLHRINISIFCVPFFVMGIVKIFLSGKSRKLEKLSPDQKIKWGKKRKKGLLKSILYDIALYIVFGLLIYGIGIVIFLFVFPNTTFETFDRFDIFVFFVISFPLVFLLFGILMEIEMWKRNEESYNTDI